ncbi:MULTISPECIES: hypothetical protein [Flavobacteriaceae]|uniref:hypothetical protein n=1 Tax=Flavobacteriaceae TaxID=49546 RepID=UPI0014913C98|nr:MULTISPECIES: hypothetical protein [Allomuricauda]MDC6366715.1 hypothetical protein [Muricauda sp. AC10]
MITGIAFLIFISFYLLYATSQKMAFVGVLGFEKWVNNHIKPSKYIGLALMVLALILSCWLWGLGAGTLTFFILLMTFSSLIVLLAPLRVLGYKTLSLAFFFVLICETLLF